MLVFQQAHSKEAGLLDRLVYTQAECWPVSVGPADIRRYSTRVCQALGKFCFWPPWPAYSCSPSHFHVRRVSDHQGAERGINKLGPKTEVSSSWGVRHSLRAEAPLGGHLPILLGSQFQLELGNLRPDHPEAAQNALQGIQACHLWEIITAYSGLYFC